MGQSVHPTGFRLRNLKNWKLKEVLVERERYAERTFQSFLLSTYLSGFFLRLLERSMKKGHIREKKRFSLFCRKIKQKKVRKAFWKWKAEMKRREKAFPRLPSHWTGKCRYYFPVFFYSHSIVFPNSEEQELHVVLYSNVKYKRFFHSNWRKVNENRFPAVLGKKRLSKFLKFTLSLNCQKEKGVAEKKRVGSLEKFFPGFEKIRLLRAKKLKRSDLRKKYLSFCVPSSFEYLNSYFSKEGYYRTFVEKKTRKMFEYVLEGRLARNFFSSEKKFRVRVHFLKSPWLNSSLCVRYLIYLLRRRKGYFPRIAGNLVTRTPFLGGEKHNLYGIFIAGAGRFTKRQRASAMKTQKGRIPFSTPTAGVEYTQLAVPLKYGACSVRVWICHLRKR